MQARLSLSKMLLLCAGLCISGLCTAQTPAADNSSKKTLASKMVTLQAGPEMERMVMQLTAGAMQPLVATWSPKIEKLPAARADKARDQLNAELKKTGDATRRIIEAQMIKSGDTVLTQAYADRFSEDELKALVAMFESDTFKKYQTAAPELGNAWVKDVVEHSRAAVLDQSKAFNEAANRIVGDAPGSAAGKATPSKKP